MGNMLSKQDQVKKLPVPSLVDTIDKYLNWTKPLCNEQEYDILFKICEDFVSNEGPLLQDRLIKYSKSKGQNSWLLPYWLKGYLGTRVPITYSGNFYLELKTIERSNKFNYVEWVSVLAHSISKAHLLAYNEELEPLESRNEQLCMTQFKKVLGASRIPKVNEDEYQVYSYENQKRYVGLFYLNNFFIVETIDENGNLLSVSKIKNTIEKILEMKIHKRDVNFNYASYGGSDKAASILDEINSNELNSEYFDKVNKTLFNISLSPSSRDEDYSEYIHKMLYSTEQNIYIYKPWSVVVTKDKEVAFNMEHTAVDGLTNILLIKEVLQIIENSEFDFSSEELSTYQFLDFELTEEISNKLEKINRNYMNDSKKFEHTHYIREGINFSTFKGLKISADAISQFAFQYAQSKCFGSIHSTYEAVDVKNFYEGRTECVRPVSNESKAFVLSLGKDPLETSLELLKVANQEHKNRIIMCKNANGVNRHMLGLSIMANELNRSCPIFESDSYKKLTTDKLSTSTIGDLPFLNRFSFAPVVENGFGVGYSVGKNSLELHLSNYQEDNEKMQIFKAALDEYFEIIARMEELV